MSTQEFMRVREHQWNIIDTLEEPGPVEVNPYVLSAAYEKLGDIYEQCNQPTSAKAAKRNARRILSSSVEERPLLVYNFYIDWLNDQENIDREAVSVAYVRLADILQEMGQTDPNRPTPRQQHWRIIDELEAGNTDKFALSQAYDKLAATCIQCGDSYGAERARNCSKVILMGSNVERQRFFIDQMEESDQVDMQALSRAYAELAMYLLQDGQAEEAQIAQQDSAILEEVWVSSGMSNRTPRSIWRADRRLTPRGKRAGDSIYSPRDTSQLSRVRHVNTHDAIEEASVETDSLRLAGNSSVLEEEHDSNCDLSLEGSVKFPPLSMPRSAKGYVRDATLDQRKKYVQGQQISSKFGGELESSISLESAGDDLEEPSWVSAMSDHQNPSSSPFREPRRNALQPKIETKKLQTMQNTGADGSLLSIDSALTIQNEVTMDCTNRAIHKLEDALSAIKVKLIHLRAEFPTIDKVKGKCTIQLVYSTGAISLKYKWRFRMHFRAKHEHDDRPPFEGMLHLHHMTPESVNNERVPFPIEFTWKDGISPTGLDYNQIVAVLTSSKFRNETRNAFKNFEQQVIDDYMPKFQQKRRGAAYKNLEGKKAADYDLALTATFLQDSGLYSSQYDDSDNPNGSSLFEGTSGSRIKEGSGEGSTKIIRGHKVNMDQILNPTISTVGQGSQKLRSTSEQVQQVRGLAGTSVRMSHAVGKGTNYRADEVE